MGNKVRLQRDFSYCCAGGKDTGMQKGMNILGTNKWCSDYDSPKINVFIYLHGYTIVQYTQFLRQENLQEEWRNLGYPSEL